MQKMQENYNFQKDSEKIRRDHEHTLVIEGRNAVLEAFRSGRTIDKVFVLDGCQDGPVRTIIKEAKKQDTRGEKTRLDLKFCWEGTPFAAHSDRQASGRYCLCRSI